MKILILLPIFASCQWVVTHPEQDMEIIEDVIREIIEIKEKSAEEHDEKNNWETKN